MSWDDKERQLAASQTFVGIDPGQSGGIATLREGKLEHISLPGTDRELWECLRWLGQENWSTAIIERVTGYMPGSAGNIGSAMFSFGCNYGKLLMALTAAEMPYEEIQPRQWQKALGIVAKDQAESKADFKRRLKVKAQQLYPNSNLTLKTCDAALIATYCQRKHQGTLAR